jgi:hypothetical protein
MSAGAIVLLFIYNDPLLINDASLYAIYNRIDLTDCAGIESDTLHETHQSFQRRQDIHLCTTIGCSTGFDGAKIRLSIG